MSPGHHYFGLVASHRRAWNALAAICAVVLVAAVLAAFGRRDGSGPAIRTAVAAGRDAGRRPSRTSRGTVAPTTAAATTTVLPTTTTVATATTLAPTTAAPAPVLDSSHRWAVATMSFTLVDTSRSTPAAPGDPGRSSRTLPTVIRYPADGPAAATEWPGGPGSHLGAPFPLIVFAHGFDSSPAVYAALLHAWAGAGYVVAAPSFPRGTAGGPLNEDDLDHQPGDLSFTLSQVLALSGPGGPLAGLVDGSHIGVAGHSDGASTAGGIGYNSCCRDARVSADAVMEGDEHGFPGGHWAPAGGPPLLVIQADHDALNPSPLGLAVFNDSRKPKYLLWLVNAQHLEPYTTDVAHLGVVSEVTTSFFDRFLKSRGDGVAAMQRGAMPGLAALTVG